MPLSFIGLNWRRKKALFSVFILVIVLCIIGAYFLFRTPRLPNLAHSTPLEITNLKSAWNNGNIIVLIRHAERCDQSSASCLNAPNGITTRGKDVAVGLGEQYQKLGLDKTDIFTSPLTRTKQTANFMFNHEIEDQEWLASCRGIMLQKSVETKRKGHNLILITHSSCIRQIEKSLNVHAPEKPPYTSSLFLLFGENDKRPQALGFVSTQDFSAEFMSRK
jgi:phosphohistidine phosphatase SixA